MNDANRRHAARKNLHLPVVLRLPAGPPLQARTIDIGLAGASIASPVSLESNRTCGLWVQVPPRAPGEPARVLELQARVIYSALSAAHGFRVGLHFMVPGEDAGRLLKTLLQVGERGAG